MNDNSTLAKQNEPFLLDARKIWYSPGIKLEKGRSYSIFVFDSPKWNDWRSQPCGPEGVPSSNIYMRMGEKMRICPDADYMELLVAVGGDRSTMKRWQDLAKEGGVYKATKCGPLTVCANDVRFMYWNNGGKLKIQVGLVP